MGSGNGGRRPATQCGYGGDEKTTRQINAAELAVTLLAGFLRLKTSEPPSMGTFLQVQRPVTIGVGFGVSSHNARDYYTTPADASSCIEAN